MNKRDSNKEKPILSLNLKNASKISRDKNLLTLYHNDNKHPLPQKGAALSFVLKFDTE